jgi:hypothetical protein
MRESAIQTAVVRYARSRGCLAVKMDVGGGWPDYLFLHQGLVLFVEFKATHGHTTALQNYTHARIKAQCFQVHVVRSFDEGTYLIDKLTTGGQQSTLFPN